MNGGTRPILALISGGLSSGRTLSLRSLEDSGWTGIDNIPPSVLMRLIEDCSESGTCSDGNLAIVVDIRTEEAVEQYISAIRNLRERAYMDQTDLRVLFLEASHTARTDRMSFFTMKGAPQTQRENLLDGDAERQLLAPVRSSADTILDTSHLTPGELRQRLIATLSGAGSEHILQIEISSFGFKYGMFTGDLVFDVRFIPNPYYVTELRALTGKDEPCRAYVFKDAVTERFVSQVSDLMTGIIPSFIAQGRGRLRIGVGCTGGRHRSVAVTEALAKALQSPITHVTVAHRELDR